MKCIIQLYIVYGFIDIFCSVFNKMQDVRYIRWLKLMESVEVYDDETLDVVFYYFVAVF